MKERRQPPQESEHAMQASIHSIHSTQLDVLKRALRATICPVCHEREPEVWDDSADVARPCEPACPVFLNIAVLNSIVREASSTSLGRQGPTVVSEICCQRCQRPGAGESCHAYYNLTCPLSRHAGRPVAILEAIAAQNRGGAAEPAETM